MMNTLLLTLLFLVLFATGAYFHHRWLRQRKITRVSTRAPLGPDQFYEKYYASSGLPKRVVLQLLKEVANASDIPVPLLRPEDRFTVELAPIKGWEFDDGLVELSWLTEDREKRFAGKVDLSKIQTVDDYIRTIGQLECSER